MILFTRLALFEIEFYAKICMLIQSIIKQLLINKHGNFACICLYVECVAWCATVFAVRWTSVISRQHLGWTFRPELKIHAFAVGWMDGWMLSQTWIVFKRFNYMNELKKWIHAYYLDSTWVFRELKSNVDKMCLREASDFGSVTGVWLIFDFCLHWTNNLAKIVIAFIFSAYQLQLPNQFHSI